MHDDTEYDQPLQSDGMDVEEVLEEARRGLRYGLGDVVGATRATLAAGGSNGAGTSQGH